MTVETPGNDGCGVHDFAKKSVKKVRKLSFRVGLRCEAIVISD